MKIQDIIFILIFAFLLYKRKPEWFVLAGIISFAGAIPFYSLWVFFTAQRLVEFGFLLLVVAVLLFAFKKQYH